MASMACVCQTGRTDSPASYSSPFDDPRSESNDAQSSRPAQPSPSQRMCRTSRKWKRTGIAVAKILLEVMRVVGTAWGPMNAVVEGADKIQDLFNVSL